MAFKDNEKHTKELHMQKNLKIANLYRLGIKLNRLTYKCESIIHFIQLRNKLILKFKHKTMYLHHM